MTFYPAYDIQKLQPAPYNPRHIDEDSLERLRESIRTLGLIKPVIATASGVLLAGHQRTRAMTAEGFTTCPAFILGDVSIQDEIRFNQLHNASDLDLGEALLHVPPQSQLGYVDIDPEEITGSLIARHAAKRGEILRLLAKHGSWGSIVVTQSGEVIVSKLYAMASKILGLPCKAYVVPNEQKADVFTYFGQTYGRFSYSHLPRTTWAQTLAQMKRLRAEGTGNKGGHSRTYEGLVFPRLQRDMRILDFGAGQMDYVRKLRRDGYAIFGIEFYFRRRALLDVGQVHRDIDTLCSDLKQHGRYDMVICDSVINSVDSLQAEHDVLLCISALCKPGGIIIYSGRSREDADIHENNTSHQFDKDRRVQFFDRDGFTAMFSEGVWRYQKFHTYEHVKALTEKYFGNDYLIYEYSTRMHEKPSLVQKFRRSSWGVVIHKTFDHSLEQRREALAREFDLPLPEGRRYRRSTDILTAYEAALTLEGATVCE